MCGCEREGGGGGRVRGDAPETIYLGHDWKLEQSRTVDHRMGRSLIGRSSRCFWQSRFWREPCRR